MTIGSRLAWIGLALLVSVPPGQAAIVDRIVAIVDREVITLSEAEQAQTLRLVRADGGELSLAEVVERLIEARLIEREVKRYPGEPISLRQEDRAIQSFRQSFPSQRAFTEALGSRQMSEPELRALARRQIAITSYLERRFRPLVYVTDREVRTYYDNELRKESQLLGETPPELDSVADGIRRVLEERKFNERVNAWIDGLKSRAYIRRYVW